MTDTLAVRCYSSRRPEYLWAEQSISWTRGLDRSNQWRSCARSVSLRALLLPILLVLSACSSLPLPTASQKPPSSALAASDQTLLGARSIQLRRDHAQVSGFRILTAGADGLLSRVQLINQSRQSLDLQYFIFRGDSSGKLVIDALARAADRGVRIRLLVDDGDTVRGDEQVLALGTHPGIEVRVFNPFRYRGHNSIRRAVEFVFNASRLDYRMHNKLMIADGAVALIGGRNIGDQYFQVDPQSQFADDDVFSVGAVVPGLQQSFDGYWNSVQAIPLAVLHTPDNPPSDRSRWHWHRRHRPSTTLAGVDYGPAIASGQPLAGLLAGDNLTWAPAHIVCDSPDKKRVVAGEAPGTLMSRPVLDAAAAVRERFLMINPYVVPSKSELQLLQTLRERHVHVGIVTNSLNSNSDSLAYAAYTTARRPLLDAGVELFEVRARLGNTRGSGQGSRISRYGNYGLHGKLMVFDASSMFIGSMNFDERSKHLNTEVGLIIDSPELAQQTATRFAAMSSLDNAYEPGYRAQSGTGRRSLQWTTREAGSVRIYRQEPARNAWSRLWSRLLAWLPVRREI